MQAPGTMTRAHSIEDFTEADGPEVLAIYNYYVLHSFAAYPTREMGHEFVQRLLNISRSHPVVVVRDETRAVVGFCLLHAFHPAGSFDRTAEIGYFLHPSHTHKGIGELLLGEMTRRARAARIRTLLASISSRNEASLSFHQKHGFEEVGRFRAIGEKFGCPFDVVYMQKDID